MRALLEAFKWISAALYFLVSILATLFAAGFYLMFPLGVVFLALRHLPRAYMWAADLAIFAQVAIGIALVVLGLPALVLAFMAAPSFIERRALSAATAIADHFGPICRTLAAPFRGRPPKQ